MLGPIVAAVAGVISFVVVVGLGVLWRRRRRELRHGVARNSKKESITGRLSRVSRMARADRAGKAGKGAAAAGGGAALEAIDTGAPNAELKAGALTNYCCCTIASCLLLLAVWLLDSSSYSGYCALPKAVSQECYYCN